MTDSSNIIITGATSGLGREMALQFAAQGGHVMACGRREDRLAELQTTTEINGTITPHRLDLSSPENITEFCDSFDSLDGIILNAGVTFADRFDASEDAENMNLIQTNVAANLQLIRGLLPLLKASQGRILIIASVGGLTPLPYQAVYAGTKAFMINFGLSLREELKHDGVKVSVFAPGGIKTEMTDIPEMKALEKDLAPVEDVARAALKAFEKMPALCVPGTQNKLIALAGKLLPRHVIAAQAERIYRKARGG